jgi:hypothetical protein
MPLSYDQFDCFCLRIWNFAQLKVPTASRELLVRLGRTTRSAFCRIATSVLHLPSIHLYMHEHLDSLGADCPFWCLKPHVPRRPSSPRRSASCDAASQGGGHIASFCPTLPIDSVLRTLYQAEILRIFSTAACHSCRRNFAAAFRCLTPTPKRTDCG